MSKKEFSKKISDYLLSHPIDRTQKRPYTEAAEKFDVSEERIRCIWRQLRNKGNVETSVNYMHTDLPPTEPVISYTYGESGNDANINQNTYQEVKSLDDLIAACSIDTDIWKIEDWECKRYNSWIKKDGDIYNEPRYSVSAKLKRKTLGNNSEKQVKVLLEELKAALSEVHTPTKIEYNSEGGLLLELSSPDLHLGKLSWADESGEDYDIKIACERYKEAIYSIAGRAPLQNVERILLPIGNDMLTIDSKRNTTTAGTPQDSDSRFRKMLMVARDLLISVINNLLTIAPVDVVVVSGNHDYDSMFTIGMVLEAYYHSNPNVNIDNTPTQRKYYQFFNTGIQFTHGDEEKHNDLGLIFATENTKLWADTKYRFCQLGHFHKNKKLQYVSVDENQGFQIQIIPSLSGTDAWHNSKGYNSLKQAKGFLFAKEEGLIAEFNYTIKK